MILNEKQERGFTWLELMIVSAIIGILAAVAIPAYKQHAIKARMSEVTNAMEYIATALANQRQHSKGLKVGLASYKGLRNFF